MVSIEVRIERFSVLWIITSIVCLFCSVIKYRDALQFHRLIKGIPPALSRTRNLMSVLSCHWVTLCLRWVRYLGLYRTSFIKTVTAPTRPVQIRVHHHIDVYTDINNTVNIYRLLHYDVIAQCIVLYIFYISFAIL